MEVLTHRGHTRHEDITQPKVTPVGLHPIGKRQRRRIGAACQVTMAGVVDFLNVEQHEVGQCQKPAHRIVHHAAIGVEADVYALSLETLEQRQQSTGLQRRFASRESHPATAAEERFLTDSHADNLIDGDILTASAGHRVGIGTIGTPEVAALDKHHKPQPGTIISAHGLKGMNPDGLPRHSVTACHGRCGLSLRAGAHGSTL